MESEKGERKRERDECEGERKKAWVKPKGCKRLRIGKGDRNTMKKRK